MILNNGEWLFNWPLEKHIITAGWYYSDGSDHGAVDFRAAVGTPVFGVKGIVDWVQYWDGKTVTGNQSYGTLVRIRCAGTYKGAVVQCLYAHLSAVNVIVGDHIEDGQLIGYTGSSGNTTGPHLHFEVRYDGERVNPLNWLDDDFSAAYGYVKLGKYTSVQKPVAQPDETPVLQTMCVVGATDAIKQTAAALGLPVKEAQATLIGPSTNGDCMTIWNMSKAAGVDYFARYEE